MTKQALLIGSLSIFSLTQSMDKIQIMNREEKTSKLYGEIAKLNKQAKKLALLASEEEDPEQNFLKLTNLVNEIQSKQAELDNILIADKHQENIKRLAEQDKEFDRLQTEAKNIHARMKELTSKIQSSDKDIIKKSETIIDTFIMISKT